MAIPDNITQAGPMILTERGNIIRLKSDPNSLNRWVVIDPAAQKADPMSVGSTDNGLVVKVQQILAEPLQLEGVTLGAYSFGVIHTVMIWDVVELEEKIPGF